jgi:hypothetical protein
MSGPRFSRFVLRAGTVGFFSSRLWISSALSHVTLAVQQQLLRPVSCLRYWRYDETAMSLRASETAIATKFSLELLGVARHAAIPDVSHGLRSHILKERKTCKIYQQHHELAFVLYDTEHARYVSFVIPVSVPLSIADTSTGETLKCIMDITSDVPGWKSFADLFPLKMESSTIDSAHPNLRYERFEEQTRPDVPRLTILCQIHRLSNVQARVYEPVAATISGVMAITLAMKAAGAVYKFRQCLELVLTSTVRIVPSLRPASNDARCRYRGPSPSWDPTD